MPAPLLQPPSHSHPPPWAYLSLAASMALVGSYVGLSKLLVAVFPVLLLAWLRFGIAAVAMAHWVRRVPGEARLSPHDRRLLFWESFLGNFLFSICMLYGVMLTSALAAGVTMAAIPAAVAVLSRVFLGEHIRPRVLAAIACAAAGIALLALVTPFGLWQAWSFDFSSVSAGLWLLLGFYAIAASMVTVWLWMQGLRHVPSSRAGVFTVLLPVSAALVAIVVLGESFGAAHVAAFALAVAGLLLATWPERAGAR